MTTSTSERPRISFVSRPLLTGVIAITLAIGACGRDSIAPLPSAAAVTVFSGDGQQAEWSQALPAPLVALVTTTDGTPVANAKVNWGVYSGGGSLSSTSSMTDQTGKASVSWTLGSTGSQVVKAWLDVAAPAATFSASPLVPLVTKTSGDAQTAGYGRALTAPLVVTVTSASGVPLANVKVSWGVTAGGGTLSAYSSMTDQGGNASVTWTLGPATNQVVNAWIDAEGSKAAAFSATGLPSRAVALHFDGSNWTESLETLTAPNGCCGFHLSKIWGASASSVFAGGGNCGFFFSVEFDGNAWQNIPECAGGGLDELYSITGTSPSDVYAVWSTAYPPNSSTTIKHFDGQNWTDAYTKSCNLAVAGCVHIRAVWSRAANDVFAVGDNLILHYDGMSWTPQAPAPNASLSAVWGDASGGVFAVGSAGTIVHYDGTTWSAQASGTTQNLTGIWGTSASDVFAVGVGGTILHFDGTSWSPQSSGTTVTLHSVWGDKPNSFFAVGDGGTIARYDGTKWATQILDELYSVNGVWGTSGSNVFAVGTHN